MQRYMTDKYGVSKNGGWRNFSYLHIRAAEVAAIRWQEQSAIG
jgi:hypothetical protein